MPDKVSILFAERINFSGKNFKSLFSFIEKNKIEHHFLTEKMPICSAFGNYSKFKKDLIYFYNQIYSLNKKELFELQKFKINIFEICKAELLSFLIPTTNLRYKDIPSNKEKLFDEIFQSYYEHLVLNMSAGMFWLETWKEKLESLKRHKFCCVFSGSLIFSRSLLEILKQFPTTPIVLESFFTGNEYYFEERYSPIANNSKIKHQNFFQSLPSINENKNYYRDRAKAFNKIFCSKNKNVLQPLEKNDLNFSNKNKSALIIGQVINDFSILESNELGNLNTIDLYKSLILGIIENTELNIIFKAHPWENQKNNVKCSLTKIELENFIKIFDHNQKERIRIVEDYNIFELFKKSHVVITICSQSAIEAAFCGKKPFVHKCSFFSNSNFVHSYEDIDEVITKINNEKINKTLSLNEFQELEKFLIKIFKHHLICEFPSGEIALRKFFNDRYFPIKILHEKHNIKEKKNFNKVERNTISEDILIKENIIESSWNVEMEMEKTIINMKKINKFIKNPHNFFNDSKFKTLRPLKRFFKNK